MVPQYGANEIEASTNWRIATTVRAVGSQFSVFSCQLTAFTFCIRRQHPFDLNHLRCKTLVTRIAQVVQVVSEQKLVLQFTCRPHRNLQKPSHFHVTFSATTFGDIHSYRCGRSPHLTCQTVNFLPRES